MPRIIANAFFLPPALGIVAWTLRGHRESQRSRFTAALPCAFSATALNATFSACWVSSLALFPNARLHASYCTYLFRCVVCCTNDVHICHLEDLLFFLEPEQRRYQLSPGIHQHIREFSHISRVLTTWCASASQWNQVRFALWEVTSFFCILHAKIRRFDLITWKIPAKRQFWVMSPILLQTREVSRGIRSGDVPNVKAAGSSAISRARGLWNLWNYGHWNLLIPR